MAQICPHNRTRREPIIGTIKATMRSHRLRTAKTCHHSSCSRALGLFPSSILKTGVSITTTYPRRWILRLHPRFCAMANIKSRKIAVLGSRSVGSSPPSPAETSNFWGPVSCAYSCLGKSSLTVQYVENHFVESYYPTIENTFSKTIKYKGQEYTTEIIDTAGQVWSLPETKSLLTE